MWTRLAMSPRPRDCCGGHWRTSGRSGGRASLGSPGNLAIPCARGLRPGQRRLLPIVPGRHDPLVDHHERLPLGSISQRGQAGLGKGKLAIPRARKPAAWSTAAATRRSRAAPSTGHPPPAPSPPGAASVPPGQAWATKRQTRLPVRQGNLRPGQRRLLPDVPGRHDQLVARHRRLATWAGSGPPGQAWARKSKLGYPTGKETCGLVNGGCYQTSRATRPGQPPRQLSTGLAAAWQLRSPRADDGTHRSRGQRPQR